jgi:hypothetical protein
VGSFYFTFDNLAEDGAFSAEEEKVLVLGVIEHLDGVALEHVFQLIVLEDVIGLPALLIDQSETVDGVDLDAFGNVHALLDDVLSYFFRLVVRL